ncbi:MAG: EAL domain-containing protein [Spirochaetales bacterium]|nr:EAL domain-containing protein [Spirochaetales bacterium]
MSDEPFVFADESEESSTTAAEAWEILIVDDDQDVHDATIFALKDIVILDRKLQFSHAHSAEEAIDYLKHHSQTAVILLDAVMETDQAGLEAVRIIREELQMEDVRIILRTGQPGHVPELETITRYDINDYKTKSELTRSKLLTTITTAIRSWEQLRRVQNSRIGLEKIVEASNQFIAARGLHTFAEGVISQMAGLFNLEPEGIVCASGILPGEEGPVFTKDGDGELYVIAAAGNYSSMINKNVVSLNDSRIVDSIRTSIDRQTTILGPDSLTVFFRENSGRVYATYIASPKPLKQVDQYLLEVFCTNISLCASNIELVNRLKSQAWEDQVLHIPNMTALMEEIDRRSAGPCKEEELLLFVDIASFSQINDLLGHDYGDEILRSLVNKLKELFQNRIYISRISADLFGLVGSREIFTGEVLEELKTMEIETSEGTRDLTLSIGVTRLCKRDLPASSHLHNAFFSLKKAKERGDVIYYNEDIGKQIREQIQTLHDLREALYSEQIFLAYQPQAEMEDNDIYSLEALLRWRKPDGTMIPPDRFIPLAEQSGLIVKLGEWVLKQALTDLKEIHDAGYPDMKMAVNVSVIQLQHPDYIRVLDKIIEESGIPPGQLELEITESVSILSLEHVLKLLGEIRDRGISIAIDDFGTGYSSLSTIDRWPVNRIKIDKSFIQTMDQHGGRIVDMVIPLGEQLSMKILAEGVETEEQLEKLKDLHCSEIQGFLLSKPLPLKELLLWLKERVGK